MTSPLNIPDTSDLELLCLEHFDPARDYEEGLENARLNHNPEVWDSDMHNNNTHN